MIITGHSLGGGLAELIGGQEEFKEISVETFNSIGAANFERQFIRKMSKQKQMVLKETTKRRLTKQERRFNPKTDKVEEYTNEPQKMIFSGDYSNIRNHVISRDFISTLFKHLGKVFIYKPNY